MRRNTHGMVQIRFVIFARCGSSYADAPPQFASPQMEIVGLLAAKHGFERYLELCTPTTGNHYAALDRSVLKTAHRLMYNCPAGFDDGRAIEFRSESLDISHCLARISDEKLRYDIMLIDGWHEAWTTNRDLRAAFDLIDDGGRLVVHDCLPAAMEVATPKYRSGEWCGLAYKAYLYFVNMRRDLDCCTVDIDCDCGVIQKRP